MMKSELEMAGSSLTGPSLRGKRILIIGGVGDGIGGAVTRTVARAGATGIVVVGRHLGRAQVAVDAVRSEGRKVAAFAADVCQPDGVKGIVDFTVRELGGLDVLITVVGGVGNYVPWQPLEETPDEHWDLMFEVNVRYVFRLLRDVLKRFLEQDAGGSIVCIGSMAAVMGMAHAAAYGASKAALSSLAKSVAAEYGRRGIRMNVVNSGAVMTEALRKGLAKETTFESVPIGRPALPEEIAELAVFLASPAAGYITGQSINVDGGMTSRGLMRMGKADSSMTCHCVPPVSATT
jgi:3-oxoacyl-[acyl-carrier protein] reductase